MIWHLKLSIITFLVCLIFLIQGCQSQEIFSELEGDFSGDCKWQMTQKEFDENGHPIWRKRVFDNIVTHISIYRDGNFWVIHAESQSNGNLQLLTFHTKKSQVDLQGSGENFQARWEFSSNDCSSAHNCTHYRWEGGLTGKSQGDEATLKSIWGTMNRDVYWDPDIRFLKYECGAIDIR